MQMHLRDIVILLLHYIGFITFKDGVLRWCLVLCITSGVVVWWVGVVQWWGGVVEWWVVLCSGGLCVM